MISRSSGRPKCENLVDKKVEIQWIYKSLYPVDNYKKKLVDYCDTKPKRGRRKKIYFDIFSRINN